MGAGQEANLCAAENRCRLQLAREESDMIITIVERLTAKCTAWALCGLLFFSVITCASCKKQFWDSPELRRSRNKLEQRVREDPNDSDALTKLSAVLLMSRQYSEAARYAARAVALSPESPEAWKCYGFSLLVLDEIQNRTERGGALSEIERAARSLLAICENRDPQRVDTGDHIQYCRAAQLLFQKVRDERGAGRALELMAKAAGHAATSADTRERAIGRYYLKLLADGWSESSKSPDVTSN